MFAQIKFNKLIIAILGGAILAFGLCNIHSVSGITEGGGLGLCLLLDHWLGISPSISTFLFNISCYAMGFKTLGKSFILYSVISSVSFSACYAVFDLFAPVWPNIADFPLLAAISGAAFVGIGSGLCVRIGGAPGADDALSMSLSKLMHVKIEWIYLISDLLVLGLSVTYIPVRKLVYSLLTVILSGQLVGLVQRFQFSWSKSS